jgi:heat-inducible transcriptional repressor
MEKKILDTAEKRLIVNIFRKNLELEEVMKNTSQLLSKLTNNIGVVIGPIIYNNHVESVQFVGIGNHRILAIIVTDTGMVYQKVINISGEIDRENLNYLSNYINSELEKNEINLIDLNTMLINELEKIIYFQKRFKYIHNFLEECFDFHFQESKIYLNGRANIMNKPEFRKIDRLNYILSFIEEENILIKIIKNELDSSRTKITIGKENKQREIQNCSLITSKYKIKGRPAGALMVLGPTRMDYPRMVSIVEYVSDKLSEILSDF